MKHQQFSITPIRWNTLLQRIVAYILVWGIVLWQCEPIRTLSIEESQDEGIKQLTIFFGVQTAFDFLLMNMKMMFSFGVPLKKTYARLKEKWLYRDSCI